MKTGTYAYFDLHDGTNVTILESLYPNLYLVVFQPENGPAKVPQEMSIEDIQVVLGETISQELKMIF